MTDKQLLKHPPFGPSDRILVGPILRHVSRSEFSIFFVSTDDKPIEVIPKCDSELIEGSQTTHTLALGDHAFASLVTFTPRTELPDIVHYEVYVNSERIDPLLGIDYCNNERPSFIVPEALKRIAHGSCRKPQAKGRDALTALDKAIESGLERPELMIHSGDQVYADDVAGPMMVAINQVITLLGLHNETLETPMFSDAWALNNAMSTLYQREKILPTYDSSERLVDFFKSGKKPIFTSHSAQNHLVSRAEFFALYMLTWSPTLWRYIDLSPPTDLSPEFLQRYNKERLEIEAFSQGLSSTRRVLANCANYMVFDDHDISDDWNLNREWEENAYGHPFSKQIICNALLSFAIFQGWGNQPEKIWLALLSKPIDTELSQNDLLGFNHWHFKLDTKPKILFLDTRTQRWRSESNPKKPSGLMDWESLCELQQELIDQPEAIIVSPAPIFGLKFIEAIQRLFTWFGHALTVDAENWMAHRGSAKVLLNMFKHNKTSERFLILSGDVHYSFVFDIKMRFRRNTVRIKQFTASGIKNAFPTKLLRLFDRLDHVLYHPRSPLNMFTKRRAMNVQAQHIEGRRVYNSHSLGLVDIDRDWHCSLLNSDAKVIDFKKKSHPRTKN